MSVATTITLLITSAAYTRTATATSTPTHRRAGPPDPSCSVPCSVIRPPFAGFKLSQRGNLRAGTYRGPLVCQAKASGVSAVRSIAGSTVE